MAIVGTFAAMSDPGLAQPTVPSPAEVVSQPLGGTSLARRHRQHVAPHLGRRQRRGLRLDDAAPTSRPAQVDDPRSDGSHDHGRAGHAEPASRRERQWLCRRLLGAGRRLGHGATDRAQSLSRPTPAAAIIATVDGPGRYRRRAALPAPALSDDGSVIVWSTGIGVVRYVRSPAPLPIPLGSPRRSSCHRALRRRRHRRRVRSSTSAPTGTRSCSSPVLSRRPPSPAARRTSSVGWRRRAQPRQR